MKKDTFFLRSSALFLPLAFLAFLSCRKEPVVSSPVPARTQSSTNLFLARNGPEPVAVRSKHWEYMEGSGRIRCPWDPGRCYKKKHFGEGVNAMYIAQIDSEIVKVNSYVAAGKMPDYFTNEGLRLLFSQVDDGSTLFDDLKAGRIYFYALPTNDIMEAGDGNVSQGYVISTASWALDVKNSNIIMAWEY